MFSCPDEEEILKSNAGRSHGANYFIGGITSSGFVFLDALSQRNTD
jgi:hypothetical protein